MAYGSLSVKRFNVRYAVLRAQLRIAYRDAMGSGMCHQMTSSDVVKVF